MVWGIAQPRLDWTGCELRQVIRDREPWRLARDVNMKLGPDSRVVIQCTERHAVICGIIEFGDDRRTAHAAKPSVVSRRGFVECDQALALHPFEFDRICAGPRPERGSLGFPAHRAMTMSRVRQCSIDPEFHAAAQATSTDHRHPQKECLSDCAYRTSSFIAPSRPSIVIGNMRSEKSRRMMVVDSE